MIIDMHCHILPKCDHGSESVEMSLRQLEEAKKAGVEIIVATPHFYCNKDTVHDFLERRERCYNELMGAVKGTHLSSLKIIKGAEVTLMSELTELSDLNKLCIEGTNSILIEMPLVTWTNWHFNELNKVISKHKLRPLIAHIDRYPSADRMKIMEFDLPFQINASSLTSFSKRGAIMKLVKEGYVEALGSDMHLDGDMYKQYKKALKILGSETEYIMECSENFIGL